MTPTRTVLAVDGNSLAHRAFHAYGPRRDGEVGLSNKAGRPVYATYGFLSLLAGICDKVGPDALVVGFDDHTSSVRKARCPEYKAQRESKGPELYWQLDDMREILLEMGLPVVVPGGLEADDVVASVAREAEEQGWRCVIATSDRDSFGLITEVTTVMRLVSGLDNAVMLTPSKLEELYGVRPDQYLDYAALRGDASDNLVGVKGIGEKTAAKLLQELGTVRAALADISRVEEVVGKACAKKLQAEGALENYERNIDIMTILRDVPIDINKGLLNLDEAHLTDVLTRWELPNLVRRVSPVLTGVKRSSGDVLESALSVPRPRREYDLTPPKVTIGGTMPEVWPRAF